MKIACYVHPVLHPNGPNWDYPWFGILARLLRTLRGPHAIEGMLISKPWHHSLAGKDGTLSLLDGLLIGMVDEISLRQRLRSIGYLPTELDRLAYGIDEKGHPALQILADEVGRCSHGFEPDVVVAFGAQADFLGQLWPKALRLHAETGAYSRNPYPFSLYFDHLGLYRR